MASGYPVPIIQSGYENFPSDQDRAKTAGNRTEPIILDSTTSSRLSTMTSSESDLEGAPVAHDKLIDEDHATRGQGNISPIPRPEKHEIDVEQPPSHSKKAKSSMLSKDLYLAGNPEMRFIGRLKAAPTVEVYARISSNTNNYLRVFDEDMPSEALRVRYRRCSWAVAYGDTDLDKKLFSFYEGDLEQLSGVQTGILIRRYLHNDGDPDQAKAPPFPATSGGGDEAKEKLTDDGTTEKTGAQLHVGWITTDPSVAVHANLTLRAHPQVRFRILQSNRNDGVYHYRSLIVYTKDITFHKHIIKGDVEATQALIRDQLLEMTARVNSGVDGEHIVNKKGKAFTALASMLGGGTTAAQDPRARQSPSVPAPSPRGGSTTHNPRVPKADKAREKLGNDRLGYMSASIPQSRGLANATEAEREKRLSSKIERELRAEITEEVKSKIQRDLTAELNQQVKSKVEEEVKLKLEALDTRGKLVAEQEANVIRPASDILQVAALPSNMPAVLFTTPKALKTFDDKFKQIPDGDPNAGMFTLADGSRKKQLGGKTWVATIILYELPSGALNVKAPPLEVEGVLAPNSEYHGYRSYHKHASQTLVEEISSGSMYYYGGRFFVKREVLTDIKVENFEFDDIF